MVRREAEALMEIVDRIENALPSLPAKQQTAARFLLDNLSSAAFYDASELAAACGVSNATMSRLVRALGFDDHRGLKEELRMFAHAGKPHAVPMPTDALGQHLAAEIANLHAVFANIDAADLDRTAKLIYVARRVVVIGRRSSYPLALHLRGQLSLIRGGVSISPVPGYTLAEDLAQLVPEDLVIVVALPIRVQGYARMLHEIQRRKVPLVLISDPTGRKHARRATVYFEIAMEAVGGIASYTTAMSLTCLIENALVSLDTGRAQETHDAIGEWCNALDE